MTSNCVEVSLTNLFDRLTASDRLTHTPVMVRTCSLDAVADPDQVYSRIPLIVANVIGITELRNRQISGFGENPVELAPLLFEIAGRQTIDEAIVIGDQVIIGSTVLSKLDLVIDEQGRVIANPAHPDGPVLRV